MPDVFISYKSEERAAAKLLAERLTERGYAVWWDAALVVGGRFQDEIQETLRQSSAVVVLWSPAAAASDWVESEADYARRNNKVAPAFIAQTDIDLLPLPFQGIETADLVGWTGERDHPGFQRLLSAVTVLASASRNATSPEDAERAMARRDTAGAELAAVASADDVEGLRAFADSNAEEQDLVDLARLRLAQLERRVGRRRPWWRQPYVIVAAAVLLVVGAVLALRTSYAAPPVSVQLTGDFSYWLPAVTELLTLAREPCPFPDFLCGAAPFLTGRRYVTLDIVGSEARDVVSCGSFSVETPDPVAAIEALSARWPQCVSARASDRHLTMAFLPNNMDEVKLSPSRSVWLCGCRSAEVASFRERYGADLP